MDRVMAAAARLHARRVLARVMADARNATATQTRVLLSHVRANADSDYGREHDFGGVRSYQDFVARVPISTYADFAPWVERVKSGDIRAMFGRRQRLHMFAMTSGTVDRPKYVPVTDRFLKDLRAGWNAFGVKALSDHPHCFLRSIVQVTSPMDEERTAAGYPCGAITGLMAATQKKLVRKYFIPPPCVAHISDTAARRYTIMRLAVPADVSWMVTASPATVLQLARCGERHAESIIRDVRDGTLSDAFAIPGPVRAMLRPWLTADRRSADRLERVARRTGTLLPKDYWNLGFLANWTAGTMGLYLREYPRYFGDVPVRDIGLLATEGRMSIPLHDGTAAGMAAVSSVFFEFIPAAQYGADAARTLRTHEVSAGQEYFVLLTTSAGFYRYDISDCVRVVGFEGQAPIIEFLHKGAHVSSITGEKITENQVVMAFERAARDTPADISTFVLAPCWADPPYYRLYVELPRERGDGRQADPARLADLLDHALRRVNMEYDSKRSSGRLGPIQAAVVGQGVLAQRDRDSASRYRAGNEQFKHQYLLTRPGDDNDLARRMMPMRRGADTDQAGRHRPNTVPSS